MAKVLNIKDCGYKVPDGAIYVGRAMLRYGLAGSKWGNPYKIGRDGTREVVLRLYGQWLLECEELRAELDELRGKDLICWCAPLSCHADVLLELTNQPK